MSKWILHMVYTKMTENQTLQAFINIESTWSISEEEEEDTAVEGL